MTDDIENAMAAEVALIRNQIRATVRRQRSDPRQSRHLAYELAGLLALPVCSRLDDDSIELRVLTLAGELELPVRHRRANATWRELRRIAERLELEERDSTAA